jgi:hypothetical protein
MDRSARPRYPGVAQAGEFCLRCGSETEPVEKWEIPEGKSRNECVFRLSARGNRPSFQ